jgi:hypothetical protein
LRCADLNYLGETERPVIKDHFIGRLEYESSGALLPNLMGIGPFVTLDDVPHVCNYLVTLISGSEDDAIRSLARARMSNEYAKMTPECREYARSHVETFSDPSLSKRLERSEARIGLQEAISATAVDTQARGFNI